MPKRLKVFIIDDALELCQELTGWLGEAGHFIRCRPASRAVIAELLHEPPDAVIYGLRGASAAGQELLQRLLSHRSLRQLPVLVFSDDASLEYDLLDIFDFQVRPFDRQRLLAGLERLRTSRHATVAPVWDADRLTPFKAFLEQHSGLHFSRNNQRLLERGLGRRMLALRMTDPQRYLAYLAETTSNFDELNKLLGLLTVGETCFFRYGTHREALVRYVLPDLIARNQASRTLRFWSAGCSTGEEPYSLALMVLEHFPELVLWDVQILATDINKRALRVAREGVYGARALRQTPEPLRERYFDRVGEHYQLDRRVRQLVRFGYFNLQADPYPAAANGTAGLDLILCRNVLIYFDLEAIRAIVGRFGAGLKPEGYLFLGHAETLQNVSDRFQRLQQHGAFFYQKKPTEPAASRLPVAPLPGPARSPVPAANLLPTAPTPPAAPAPPAVPPVVAASPLPAPAPVPLCEDPYADAMDAFDHEDYPRAEAAFDAILARQPGHPRALVGKGLIHANRGDYDLARQLCARAIRHDDLCPEAYLLRGLILDMEGELERALVEYQKVLWLDRDFIMGHYLMAKVCHRLQRPEAVARALRNTLRCLEKWAQPGPIPFSGGLTRAVFLEVCRRELEGLRS